MRHFVTVLFICWKYIVIYCIYYIVTCAEYREFGNKSWKQVTRNPLIFIELTCSCRLQQTSAVLRCSGPTWGSSECDRISADDLNDIHHSSFVNRSHQGRRSKTQISNWCRRKKSVSCWETLSCRTVRTLNAGKTKAMWCQVSKSQIRILENIHVVHSVSGGVMKDVAGKLKSDVDFHCNKGLEGSPVQSISLRLRLNPMYSWNVYPSFPFWVTLGAGKGVEETARARVRCAWAKFNELSPILALVHHILWRERYTELVSCVDKWVEKWWRWRLKICIVWRGQSVWWWDGYEECRWRIESEVFYSLLSIQSVTEVVRHGILRWFGHLECKSGDDWVSASRNVEVVGRRVGAGNVNVRHTYWALLNLVTEVLHAVELT